MGQAAVHRELRRETKRTLGNHLKDFAQTQHAGLLSLGDRVTALERGHQMLTECVKTEADSRAFSDTNMSDRLRRLESLTFGERLRFLFTGELPIVTWSWNEKQPCDVAPSGWTCTRAKGHDGPCAAVKTTPETAEEREAFAQDIGRP